MTAAAHVTDEIIASKGFGTACVCFCGDISCMLSCCMLSCLSCYNFPAAPEWLITWLQLRLLVQKLWEKMLFWWMRMLIHRFLQVMLSLFRSSSPHTYLLSYFSPITLSFFTSSTHFTSSQSYNSSCSFSRGLIFIALGFQRWSFYA